MCGICGVVRFPQTTDEDWAALQRVDALLRHRGPDDAGSWRGGPAALAMRRLAVIDLQGGRQPMTDEGDDLQLVLNGEIYNYDTLRAELASRGHRLATQSDAEVALHLYQEMGPAAATRLNGMFALALWDSPRRRLWLCRDPLGIKPLYYGAVGGAFWFASELPALMAGPAWPRRVDPQAVNQYLALRYIPAPRTAWQGVHKLLAGCSLLLDERCVAVSPYWELPSLAGDQGARRSDGEWAQALQEAMRAAVRRQMVSDVPLGASLSGGLDSSAVVAFMAEARVEPVHTFAVTFPGWPGLDERPYARRVAQHLHTRHREIELPLDVPRLFEEAVAASGEPLADPAALPTLAMARAARQEVTVALTGEGADELLGGYGWYRWAQRPTLPVPRPLRQGLLRTVRRACRGRRGGRTVQSYLVADPLSRYADLAASSAFQTWERERIAGPLLREALSDLSLEPFFAERLAPGAGGDWQARFQRLDLLVWLEGDPLAKADRMTMAASLEARLPFLDREVVELALAMPPDLLVRGATHKYVLRQAVRSLLPPEVASRRKHAFDPPVGHWLRGPLRERLQALPTHPGVAGSGVLDPAPVAKLVRAQLAGRDHGRGLWTLLVWAAWWEQEGA
ncbi:MAG: asparagine synthase (glutamine-hydrolyzing) [Chloroflexi bacterium]|nr:asparagine synthase (glutamine-hydrolyzing) [Chloroflexota bacterium]